MCQVTNGRAHVASKRYRKVRILDLQLARRSRMGEIADLPQTVEVLRRVHWNQAIDLILGEV